MNHTNPNMSDGEMAARTPRNRMWTPEIVRERIRTSMIALRLTDHVLGKIEMSATQVSAALGLLRKTLPDLQAVAHSGHIGIEKPEELSEAELDRRIALASGKEATTASPQELPELH